MSGPKKNSNGLWNGTFWPGSTISVEVMLTTAGFTRSAMSAKEGIVTWIGALPPPAGDTTLPAAGAASDSASVDGVHLAPPASTIPKMIEAAATIERVTIWAFFLMLMAETTPSWIEYPLR